MKVLKITTFGLTKQLARFFKPYFIWDWYDFGIMLKINKQNNTGNYHFAIDIQIGWLNLWVQCWQKH
jgi:hypothetical protein